MTLAARVGLTASRRYEEIQDRSHYQHCDFGGVVGRDFSSAEETCAGGATAGSGGDCGTCAVVRSEDGRVPAGNAAVELERNLPDLDLRRRTGRVVESQG